MNILYASIIHSPISDPSSGFSVPPSVGHLMGENHIFKVPLGDFGGFAQQLSDTGLVFNIRFVGDEMHQLSWSLFN